MQQTIEFQLLQKPEKMLSRYAYRLGEIGLLQRHRERYGRAWWVLLRVNEGPQETFKAFPGRRRSKPSDTQDSIVQFAAEQATNLAREGRMHVEERTERQTTHLQQATSSY